MTIVTSEATTGSKPSRLLARALRQPRARIAVAWLVLLAGASIVIPLLGVMHPLDQDPRTILQLPSGSHWLGTDDLGRDILARLLYGARDALLLSLESVVVSVLIGTPLGLWAGFGGRTGDWLASRLADLLLAIPGIIVLLTVVTVAGNNMPIAMAVFGLLVSAGNIRLVRASTRGVVQELYVSAARVAGLSPRRIAVRHVLPNVAGPLIVQASIVAGISLLTLTGLQFLGLGPNPPAPSWGSLVSEASANVSRQKWMMVPTGLFVIMTVLSFNQLGDAFRDALGGTARNNMLKPARTLAAALRKSPPPERLSVDEALVVDDIVVTAEQNGRTLRLVDGVSFTVGKGETVGIVGESGCGKSMTANAILGLLPSNVVLARGTVTISGENVTGLGERELRRIRGRRIAAIPQEPMTALDPNFPVGKQLIAPLRRLRGLSRSDASAEAVRLLGLVGIVSPETVMRRFPHEISGGMAQRVCIAQALIGQPEVLIADEPTTALDVTVQAEILDLLRELQDEMGMAIVIVTHNLGVIADMCDRALVMYAGQVVEYVTARELLRSPRHPYTLGLIHSAPAQAHDGADLPAIPGTVPRPEEWPTACRFADRCAWALDDCRVAPVELATTSVGGLSRCLRVADLEAAEFEAARLEGGSDPEVRAVTTGMEGGSR